MQNLWTALWNDIRYGTRVLVKSPLFTLVCIVTLALGIGANTAMFSVVNPMLFKPLPVKDAQQLTVLAFRQKQGPLNSNFSFPELRDLRASTAGSFSDVFAYQLGLDGLSVNGRAERVVTSYVTGNFFSALGIKPILGSWMRPGEGETNGNVPGIVLGYDYWQSRFAGSPSVIGQKVLLNGHPSTIMGVAPKGFHGVNILGNMQAYIPLALVTTEGVAPDFLENRTLRNLTVLARLRPDHSLTQARALLDVAAAEIAHDHPESDKDLTLEVFREQRARPGPDSGNSVVLISSFFLVLSALVLLLACVNVANILLVRATIRQREMAIRVALGAARNALVRQLLTESLLLGLCGGACGVVLGLFGSLSLSSVPLGTDLPLHFDFTFDWRVFVYAFAAALIAGLVVGAMPASRASKANINEILHQGGRGSVGGRQRLRNVLVAGQVAASLTLLIIAGLFMRSLAEAQNMRLGFNPSHLVNFDMDPSEIGYTETQGQIFYRNVLDRVRALPGVKAASLAANVPMGYINAVDAVVLPEKEKRSTIAYNVVTPSYFETMEIEILSGRGFTDADKLGAAFTAVISEGMAKELWPNQDPIGRGFYMASDTAHLLHVVGTVNDTKQTPRGRMKAFFYVPLAQHYTNNSFETLQVRSAGDPKAIIPEVERSIHALASDLPVFDVATMSDALYTLNGLLMFQIAAGLAGTLGLVGLVLAVVGVYGVISYAANQQTHEIGLRMALGAKPMSILSMVLSRGLVIVGAGLIVGLVASIAAAEIVGKLVVVSPTDPATYSAVTVLLIVIALLACYIPARRAMRVDPMVALRYD